VSVARPRALIADDEPLLRDALERLLAQAWPQLEVVARARNGREAIDLFDAHRPEVCFLDVQMPGKTGVEAAAYIGRRAHLVFVTAFDEYAVEAFAHGVLDYLVKPVEPARLVATVARVQERLHAAAPVHTEALLAELAASLRMGSEASPLRWLRASVGQAVQLISIETVDFFRSDQKYTVVAWRDDARRPREAVIRMALKDLGPQLDAAQFAQVHRSVIVNLSSIERIVRGANETADIHLRGRDDVLPVSRNHLHLFKQM
jgi:DNA-binding LytR/AlgR family response regulator